MGLGMTSWLWLEYTHTDADFWPPQLAGLLFGWLGMLLGSLLPQISTARAPVRERVVDNASGAVAVE
jgi:hypothetical protein